MFTSYKKPTLGYAAREVAANLACANANQDMIPDGGSIAMVYDKDKLEWTCWYASPEQHTVGFQGQGKNPWDAIRHMESLNSPHPEVLEGKMNQHRRQ